MLGVKMKVDGALNQFREAYAFAKIGFLGVMSETSEFGLKAIQDSTPECGHLWKLIETQSNLGAKYHALVDHPYNEPGAKSARTGKPVNTPSFNLLLALEYGTRAHEIVAKIAGALHWVDEGGNDVFRKRVHHPGTRPYAMIELSMLDAESFIRGRIQMLEARITKKAA